MAFLVLTLDVIPYYLCPSLPIGRPQLPLLCPRFFHPGPGARGRTGPASAVGTGLPWT